MLHHTILSTRPISHGSTYGFRQDVHDFYDFNEGWRAGMATVNVVLGGHENRPVNSVDGLWNGDIEVMQIMIISLMMNIKLIMDRIFIL